MPSISIEANVKEVVQFLTRLEKKQLPFATSRAINDVAFGVRKKEMKEMPKHIDRPTPFSVKSFQVKKSNKKQKIIEGTVFIKPKQWGYLEKQVKGGTRAERKMTTPVNVKTNKYGNIPALRRKKPRWKRGEGVTRGTFVGTRNGTTGVWGRVGKKRLRLLVAFINKAVYKKALPFKAIAEKEVKKTFNKIFDRELIKAIKTARR